MKNLLPMQAATIFFTLLAAALLIPMPKWQGILGKIMKKRTRLMLAAASALAMAAMCAVLYISADVTLASDASPGTYPILRRTATPASTPSPSPEPAPEFSYVLNTSRMKFHYPDCASVGEMAEHNKSISLLTRQEIIEDGYEPCGRCKP